MTNATRKREDWLDEIATEQRHRWARPTPMLLEAMLRTDLPCRIRQSYVGSHPVLHVAIGTNGTHNYWQWATLDRVTSEPLPKEQAMAGLMKIIDLTMITSKSIVIPKLLNA